MTTIRYFIPEDGDSEFQPNIFLAPKSRQQGYPPTLGQIKQSFPLLGRYHFRFKTSLVPGGNTSDSSKNHLAVWMDCIDDNIPVPVWQSQIIAKITRIGVEEEDDDDDDEDFRRPTHSTSQTAATASSSNVAMGVPLSQAPPPQQQQPVRPPVAPSVQAPSFDLFGDGPSVATTQNNHHQQQQHNMAANLFDTVPAAPSASSTSSLFDMSYQPTSTTSAVHSDFLGMTTAPSPPVSGNYRGGYPSSSSSIPQQPPQRSMNSTASSAFGASSTSTNSGGGGAFGDLAWK